MVLPVERWHARARLAREAAKQIADEERRSLMLLYAAECERIADQCLLGFAPAEETGDADPSLATASLPRSGDIPGDPQDLPFASTDERLVGIYRYWCERRGERKFPRRQDMDPLDFSFALGRISIIEVQLAPRNFRYRLVSTQLTEHLGYEMSGKTVDAIPDAAMREFARSFYERVLERAAPTYENQSVVIGGLGWWHETLALPLATDGETIDMLLIYRNTERPVAISPAA